jgi:hypothetical protein
MTENFAMTQMSAARRSAIWAAVLALTALLGSWALACAMPFAGFAAVSARTLRLRDALGTMAVIWLANQAVGFLVLDYPADAVTLAWGAGLGIAALAACVVASRVLTAALIGARPIWQRLPLAFVAAYAAYEAVLIATGLALGDGMETFSPAMVADIGMINALWFVGLAAVGEALMGKGLLVEPNNKVSA